MKELKKILFGFENCETLTVSKEYIGECMIDNIHTKIRRIACNSIEKMVFAENVVLEIFAEVGKEHIKRLSYADITSLDVYYEDGSKDEYFVPWGDDDDSNAYEDIYQSPFGNLYIIINTEKNLTDYQELIEEANDEKEIQFKKDLYGIGVQEEEIHEYTENSLPELYRYVYLYDHTRCSGAMRISDENAGWRFVFEDEPIHFPTSWQYPTSDVEEYIQQKDFVQKYGLTKQEVYHEG